MTLTEVMIKPTESILGRNFKNQIETNSFTNTMDCFEATIICGSNTFIRFHSAYTNLEIVFCLYDNSSTCMLPTINGIN